MSQDDRLKGARILVVEDSLMLAEVLCEYLTHHELTPVGPAASIESACHLAGEADIDAAILDIKLASRFSFPVCTILADRSIPYLFLTGVDELSVIPPEFREVPLLCKPFREDDMQAALEKLLEKRAN